MECEGKFYFTSEQLADTPSTKDGISIDDEINCHKKSAIFIQSLGEKLKIPQLCINTAIVYVKRFFMYHSLKKFLKYRISLAALFLACKTEDVYVKSEYFIYLYFKFVSPNDIKVNSEEFNDELANFKFNEILIMMTLGFETIVEHPHLHIVKHAPFIQVRKDVLKLAYFTASKCLHLTSLCLQYTPKIVACFSIHLAALKFQVKIPNTEENQPWFSRIEKSVTYEFLDNLTKQYFNLFDKHQPWFSIAKKMINRKTIITQSPQLNLNLSIGISTKRLDISDNIQSPLFKINQSNSDINENLHLSHAKNDNLSFSQNIDNQDNRISSTFKTLQLKSNDLSYFSPPNREILQSLFNRNCLMSNEKEILQQSDSRENLFLFSNIHHSNFVNQENSSYFQNNHSTPKISESLIPSINQLTPIIKKNELSFQKENYPRSNFLKSLESSNVDHLTSNNSQEAFDLSLFQNYTSENYFSNQSKSFNYDIWQPFLSNINQSVKIDSCLPTNERCQEISLKRQSNDLNDSIINKRRCLSGINNSVPQYKFNFL